MADLLFMQERTRENYFRILSVILCYFICNLALTILFQITMPGLDEEIMFRGVLLGLMCSCLRNDGPIWRNPANLITSILFGLVHALNVDGGYVSFSISSLIWTGMIGYGLGYMTLKTRSILLAIVAHNLCNFLQNVVAML